MGKLVRPRMKAECRLIDFAKFSVTGMDMDNFLRRIGYIKQRPSFGGSFAKPRINRQNDICLLQPALNACCHANSGISDITWMRIIKYIMIAKYSRHRDMIALCKILQG